MLPDVDPETEQPPGLPDEAGQRALSVLEFFSLAATIGVGIVALVSLVLAHLSHFTLTNVVVLSVALVVVVGLIWWIFDRRPLRLDLPGLIPAVVGMGLSGAFFFPGFQYGTGDRDPGAYIEIAASIQSHHSLTFTDDLVAAHLPGGDGPGAVWPAIWQKPGDPSQIFPQFYHLWPALLASAKSVGGYTGLFDTGPLLALIAVALAVAIGRRIAGVFGAWVPAVILPTNMLEVWQAKYPSAEIFGQLLFLGAVLGIVLAIRNGWRFGAAAAGALLSLAFLERADGLILILFGWGVVCLMLAVGRFDARVAWFAGGLVVLLPYAFWQAWHLALHYTQANGVPSQNKVLAVMLAVLVIALLLRWQLPRWAGLLEWGNRPRTRFWLGGIFIGVCAVLVVIAGLRPKLFGADYATTSAGRTRTYDEISFIRLTWFFSLTGIALMCAGIVYVGWYRWRLDRWLIGVATAGLMTIYCYHVRNSPYLMWDTRRFVTTVVPGIVLLMACGIALIVFLIKRYLPVQRFVAAACVVVVAGFLVGLGIFGTSESWPLHSHNENGGSIEVEHTLALLSGSQKGVYLWTDSGGCCDEPWRLFGGPMLTIQNQSSALLPGKTNYQNAAIKSYVSYFKTSSRPVFLVLAGRGPAPVVAGVQATKVLELAGQLPHWAETYVSRPKTTHNYPYDFSVYRLSAVSGGSG